MSLSAIQDPSNDDRLPDYEDDDRIESALNTLDDYQEAREQMGKHFKMAFYELARAKQALGPARVGPASFRLGRIEPLITVDIEGDAETDNTTFHLRQLDPPPPRSDKGKEKEKEARPREFPSKNGAIDLRLAASTSSMKLGEDLNEKTGLRSRAAKNVEKPALTVAEKPDKPENTDSADPPAYNDAVNEHLIDPILQFSALPPISLRNSQREFRRALEESMRVLANQQKYGQLCQRVEKGGGS